MRYTVKKSFIQAIGTIWLPPITAAHQTNLTDYDLRNMQDDNGKITRDSVEYWLSLHSGDFQSIDDFYADIETDSGTLIIPWANEESELTFNDCMYPEEK